MLALGLLIVMGALVYQSSRALVHTFSAAHRSQQALTTLEGIQSLMAEAESEQRLYYLTGEETDLQRRHQALAQAEQLTGRLRGLVADDATLAAMLPQLEQRIADRRRLLDNVLEGYHRGGLEEVKRRLLSASGRQEMRGLHDVVGRMQAAELARLESRERNASADANRTVVFVALLLLLSLISASALYLRIRREMRERQQAQETLARQTAELRENEARLQAIVQTATDGIIVIDERGLIDRFNSAAERIFGYPAAEVLGKNVSMLMPSPEREQHDGYLARYLAGGAPRIIGIGREVVARRKDGSTFPIDLAVSEMRLGDRRMFTGIVRDISARKRGEEQRNRLIQELQSANDELTNFAYVVSHDLKAPLRAIGSLADWLNADYGDRLDAEGKEHLRLLKSRVERMDRLIEGILEYSRVGRVREMPVPVDINVTVKDAIALLDPPAHIRIVVEDELPTVTAEPTRLQQVFQNLLSNAIKYLDKPQGVIRIGCRVDDGMWRFSVSDNGPGIEARHHEKIFHLFQTLAPRDRIESTGVGLALVKKIVELYGGRIWLDSVPGQGSTFYFTFPKDASSQHYAERKI